ncbi:MAG: diacylglycerol kinase [Dehalococcoidia bacterium]
MQKFSRNGPLHLLDAVRFTCLGLMAAVRHQEAFRQELVIFAVAVPVALWLGDTGVERALLIGSLLVVLVVEMLNSAIETVVNRVGTEFHELSGRAKDMGSAAVFLSIVNAVVVWALVLLG